MNISKNRKEELSDKDVCPKKKRTFWDDLEIGKRLDALPDREMSYEIRVALRKHFGISQASEPSPNDAEQLRTIFRLLQSK